MIIIIMVRAFHWQYVLQYELSLFYIIFIIVLSLENKYTIQYNTMQYNTIQCNAIQYNTIITVHFPPEFHVDPAVTKHFWNTFQPSPSCAVSASNSPCPAIGDERAYQINFRPRH